MAGRLLRDPDQEGWERSDMPIACESCLGPSPFVRIQRIEFGGTCHISGRPYTVFRWRPGPEARYKKTIICQEVAKAKNVCQVCLLDLEYNLPVQVRDQALGLAADDEPQSEVGKEFKLQQQSKVGESESSFTSQRPNDILLKLQRTAPYYKRNEARVCSFFAKGACTRGAECPYRHEMPLSGELSKQNMKDRYYGVNDPVANKMMRQVSEKPELTAPEDQTITTLYIGGLVPEIAEDDLRDKFYSFGEISQIRKVESKKCAFITFTTRAAAEAAVKELAGKLLINGNRCSLLWGKPLQQQQQLGGDGLGAGSQPGMPPPQGAPPPGPNALYGAEGAAPYASMDPMAMGSHIPAPGAKRPADVGAMGDGKRAHPGPPASGYGSHLNLGPRPPPGMPPPQHPHGPPMYPPHMMPGYAPPPRGPPPSHSNPPL